MSIITEPTYLYKGQTARLFQPGDERPEGWNNAPEVPYAADGEWEHVIAEFHTPKPKPGDGEQRRGPGRPPKPVDAVTSEG